jgi:hypothetical protein
MARKFAFFLKSEPELLSLHEENCYELDHLRERAKFLVAQLEKLSTEIDKKRSRKWERFYHVMVNKGIVPATSKMEDYTMTIDPEDPQMPLYYEVRSSENDGLGKLLHEAMKGAILGPLNDK